MKKTILLSTLLLTVFNLLSQAKMTPLTVKAVYDFNVGDVFEYEIIKKLWNVENTLFIQHQITGKTCTSNQCTYIIKSKSINESQQIDTATVVLNLSELDSVIYKQLPENTILLDPILDLIVKSDTTFLSNAFGGGKISQYQERYKLNVSAEHNLMHQFMEGLGVVFTHEDNIYPPNGDNIFYEKRLIFYKKATKTWGNPIDFTPKPIPYYPMANEGAQWYYNTGNKRTQVIFLQGDSTYNNLVYKKAFEYTLKEDSLKSNPPNDYTYNIEKKQLIGLIRDDIANKKVYYVYLNSDFPKGNCSKNQTEFLLFDFNVKKKDTLNWCALISEKLVVDDIFADRKFRNLLTTNEVQTNSQSIFEMVGFGNTGIFDDRKTFFHFCIYPDIFCRFKVKTKELINESTSNTLVINVNEKPILIPYSNVKSNEALELRYYNTVGQLLGTTKFDDAPTTSITINSTNQVIILVISQRGRMLGYQKCFIE